MYIFIYLPIYQLFIYFLSTKPCAISSTDFCYKGFILKLHTVDYRIFSFSKGLCKWLAEKNISRRDPWECQCFKCHCLKSSHYILLSVYKSHICLKRLVAMFVIILIRTEFLSIIVRYISSFSKILYTIYIKSLNMAEQTLLCLFHFIFSLSL